jgi:hypothetical protein
VNRIVELSEYVILQQVPEEEYGNIFEKFSWGLGNFLSNETHPYRKFKTEDLLQLLNHIARQFNDEYETSLSFHIKDGQLGISSDRMDYEISLLPHVYKQFKRCYKCSERCYENDNGRCPRYNTGSNK